MEILPAIDLYGGKVVRLTEGLFHQVSSYSSDPVGLGESFMRAGARWVHVVDLEGARFGQPKHLHILRELKSLGLKVQFGGGLRSSDKCLQAMMAGADRVMVGSALLDGSADVRALASDLKDALVGAVDHRGGRVSIRGWTEETCFSVDQALAMLEEQGVRVFLVTCADRDGTMTGPDLQTYRRICMGRRVIAAGGISSIEDLKALQQTGAIGAVLGKCLYHGSVNLSKALEEFS